MSVLESATRASPAAGNAIVDDKRRREAHARVLGAAHEFTVEPLSLAGAAASSIVIKV